MKLALAGVVALSLAQGGKAFSSIESGLSIDNHSGPPPPTPSWMTGRFPTPPPPPACADNPTQPCGSWKAAGYCAPGGRWPGATVAHTHAGMKKNCRKTCGFCTAEATAKPKAKAKAKACDVKPGAPRAYKHMCRAQTTQADCAKVELTCVWSAANDATAMHRALQTTVDANGDHHLYFHSIDKLMRTCGHVDAAPFMPAELFEPANIVALWTYVTFTTSLYTNPNTRATPLASGKCTNKHNVGLAIYKPTGTGGAPTGTVSGINWFGGSKGPGTLMGPICAAKCGCDFKGLGPAGLPACTDAPDDPSKDRFCSLCGPTTACPGCKDGTDVTIQLFRKCPDPSRPAWNKEWCGGKCLDIACDDLPKNRKYCGGHFPAGCRASAGGGATNGVPLPAAGTSGH